MKTNCLFLILAFCLLATGAFAQEENSSNHMDIFISGTKTEIPFNAKSVIINVKITNFSSPIFLSQLNYGYVFVSRMLDKRFPEQTETALLGVERKFLKTGEPLEFQIDLKRLFWLKNPRAADLSLNESRRSPYKPLLLGKYFLSVILGDCKQKFFENSNISFETSLSYLKNKNCESNKILLDFDSSIKSE